MFVSKYGGINSKLALKLAYKEGKDDASDIDENMGSDDASLKIDSEDEED